MNPLVQDYRVGIVIPRAGINEAQLLEISYRLADISKVLPDDGHIYVYVPGFNLADAEASVVRPLRNMLERKGKVWVTYIPTGGEHKAGVAALIVYELGTAKRCDEVWCCPAPGQRAKATARVAQVYALSQQRERPARYKLIPPWVEPVKPPKPIQPETKGKSWRDMINKRNFHW